MFGPPPIDAPVFAHERDRGGLGAAVAVAGTFGGRETIGEDLEVIPIPRHTPGSTAFLWDGGRHRFLFTGDSVWCDRGRALPRHRGPRRGRERLDAIIRRVAAGGDR